MKIIYGIKDLGKIKKQSVVTIGVFDGIHRGHSNVIEKVVKDAKKLNCKSIVITFDPHPESLLQKRFVPKLISLEHRLDIIRSIGVDMVLILNFTKTFSKMSAVKFIKLYLKKRLKLKELVVSENFCLGKKKTGDINVLKSLSEKLKFSLKVLKALKNKGIVISSTLIRNLVLKGKLAEASLMLKRPFSIVGKVIKGKGYGKKYGFPTANIKVKNEVIPPNGVYVVYVKLGNRSYKGALSIGSKPTFQKNISKEPYVEVYILNFSKKIYGKEIEIIFVKKIRNQKKFKNAINLYKEVKKDIVKVKAIK